MYARRQSKGIGKSILAALEKGALTLKYRRILLEIGLQNQSAINFYFRIGYIICENYGKYIELRCRS